MQYGILHATVDISNNNNNNNRHAWLHVNTRKQAFVESLLGFTQKHKLGL